MKIWKRLQDMTFMQFLAVLAVAVIAIGGVATFAQSDYNPLTWSNEKGAPAPNGPAEFFPPTMPEQDRLDPKLPADGPTDMIAPSSFCEDGPTGRVDHEGNCVDDIVMPVDPERHMNIPPVDSWNQELNTESIPDPDFN